MYSWIKDPEVRKRVEEIYNRLVEEKTPMEIIRFIFNYALGLASKIEDEKLRERIFADIVESIVESGMHLEWESEYYDSMTRR